MKKMVLIGVKMLLIGILYIQFSCDSNQPDAKKNEVVNDSLSREIDAEIDSLEIKTNALNEALDSLSLEN
ncbi:MAG: hypothetical protein M3Q97_00465 [Bacteroidota bacterium]|nr:hypothetical protein [Bacteroidota bacterium]